jgi:hypothetical protein
MGYMFRLTVESSSGPRDVGPDIQTFTALWDPQRLQNIKHTLNIHKTSVLMVYKYVEQES